MNKKLDLKSKTWYELSEIVHAVYKEMKRRNPIGVNMYAPVVKSAASLLKEIAAGESENPTSEA